MHALILMPAIAVAYSYWPIRARITLDDAPLTITYRVTTLEDIQNGRAVDFVPEGFMWGDDVVDCRKYTDWIVVTVTAETQNRLDYLVRYQTERLWSGLYPSYTYQPDSLSQGERES
jgi:hypothetical protein